MNLKKYTVEPLKKYALPFGVSSAIALAPVFSKIFKPTYAQVIREVKEDFYSIFDEESLKKTNVIIEPAIILHKVNGSYKFEPNRAVLDSMNTEELQRWYDGGLEEGIEKKIKETDMLPVYKNLIIDHVKPWLVEKGYVKAPEPEYTIPLTKTEEKAMEEKVKVIFDATKPKVAQTIDEKLIPAKENPFIGKSDEEVLDSYIKTNQYIASEETQPKAEQDSLGLGTAYSDLVKLKDELTKRKVSTEAYNYKNVQIPTDAEIQNIRIIEYLKEMPELLDKLVADYPVKFQGLAKLLVLEGLPATDEYSLALGQDSIGTYLSFGDWLKSRGLGQIDKLVTYADGGTRFMTNTFGNPRDFAESGKYYNTYTEGEGSITDFFITINDPIHKAIYGKPLDPNNVPIGHKMYISLNDIATTLGVSEDLVKFSQEMVKTRLGTFLLADVIEKLIYTEKELQETLDREAQLAKKYSNVEVLREAMEDLIAQANNDFGNLDITQVNSLAKAGNEDAKNFLKLFNLYQEQYTSWGQELAARETDLEESAIANEKILQEKIAIGEEKAKLLVTNTELDSLYQDALDTIKDLKSQINTYLDSTKSLKDLVTEYKPFKEGYNKLFEENKQISILQNKLITTIAKTDSLEQVAEEQRKRAEKAEAQASGGYGLILERLFDKGLEYSFGFWVKSENYSSLIGLDRLGLDIIGFSFSPEGETIDYQPLSKPTTNPLRPKLIGESITNIEDITKRKFWRVDLGFDKEFDDYLLRVIFGLGQLKTDKIKNVEEILNWKNQQGEIIATDKVPKSEHEQSKSILFSVGGIVYPYAINKKLPINVGAGLGLGYSPNEEAFLRLILSLGY